MPCYLGKKHVTAHYRQAKLNSRNLINIATETGLRQHGYPANRDKGARNLPSKPGFMHFCRNAAPCELGPPGANAGLAVVLKKSPQESTLNSLLYYAQSSVSQDAGKKPTLSTFYRNRPYCFICVMDSGLWRFKIREQHGSCGQGKCFLAFHGGRRGRRTERIGRKFRQC